MEIELREKEAEDRIRNVRAHDVEGKSLRDRKQVVVKGGKHGGKKWVSFFCGVSPGCGSIKSILGLIRVRV